MGMVWMLRLHFCLLCYILLPWVFLCGKTIANVLNSDSQVPVLDSLSKSQLSKLVDELLSKANGGQQQTELQECQNKFETKNDRIIRTRDSLQNGAQFLVAVPRVKTAQACFQECCKFKNGNENLQCDLSVFQVMSARQDVPQCFLFDCVNESKDNTFLCLFSQHTGYVTYKRKDPISSSYGILQTTTASKTQIDDAVTEVNSITDFISPIQTCSKFEWKCVSGVCINMFSVCNKVLDCSDGSDEFDCPDKTWEQNDEKGTAVTNMTTTITSTTTTKSKKTTAGLTLLPNTTIHSTALIPVPSLATEKKIDDQNVSAVHPEQGALLPLALGLAVTVCVLVMVLCRLKIMKKKFLKKPGPLLMDESDYLINGMYL